MKTKLMILFLAMIILPLIMPAQTPTPIGRHANLSLFSGYFAKRQNTNNNGYWLGAYGDLPFFRSQNEKFNFGLWGLYAHSKWGDNLAQYDATTNDFAFGLNGGYYSEYLSPFHAFYIGAGIGCKYSNEIGKVEKKKYFSEGKQEDFALVGNINLNLLKSSGYHPRLFPRTQLVISGQMSLSAKKNLSENGKADTIADAWKKNYAEITLKQSLVDIPLNYSGSVFLQPKLGVQYDHFQAGDPYAYAYLVEIAFHKESADDFLSLVFMQKFYPGDKDYLFVMLNINILKLINH